MASSPLPPHLIVKHRWLGFLIWQSIASSALLLLLRPSALLLSAPAFVLALLLFSLALFLLSSPVDDVPFFFSSSSFRPSAGAVVAALRVLVGGSRQNPTFAADLAGRARFLLRSVGFLALCVASGFLSAVALYGELDFRRLVGVGLRGVVFGLVYGSHYLFRKRWILAFPIVQRPLFYSFKMGLLPSLRRATKLSFQAYLYATILLVFVPDQFKMKYQIWRFIFQQIKIFVGTTIFSFCWELSHHLLEVVLTKRCIFAPPQGSAAAETNPSETLLETLEQRSPRSLIKHLSYLDLCVVSESNCEPWRRAALFEETGDTYKRTISICLKPLEQLTSTLAEGLEVFSKETSDFFTKQLTSSENVQANMRLYEAFSEFQICSWSVRALSALTSRSRSEDKYGVAQLTGCNKAVISTMLSCLLSVEACLGKKTNLQATISPANIRWATFNTGRADQMTTVMNRRRSSLLHANAYAMADVLRTSIYQIVSAFHADMQANAKASMLDKSWISEGKPLYGTREILVQKLSLFLAYQAV